MRARRSGRPLVYAAHPVTTYGSELERRALDRIAKLAPGAKIINPAERYWSSADWLSDWPHLLPTLSALVVFGDEDGAVGTGCIHELADAWFRGLPVSMLDGQGEFRLIASLSISPARRRSPLRTAFLVPGEPLPGLS